MKTPSIKKLFVFSMTTMLFCALTEFANAQFKCNRRLPCPTGTTCKNGICVPIFVCTCKRPVPPGCAPLCGTLAPISIPLNTTTSNDSYQANSSKPGFIPIAIGQSVDNSTKLFEIDKKLIMLPDNYKTKLIYKIDWEPNPAGVIK